MPLRAKRKTYGSDLERDYRDRPAGFGAGGGGGIGFNFSMGKGPSAPAPEFVTMSDLPVMVPINPQWPSSPPSPPAIDRRDQPSNEVELPGLRPFYASPGSMTPAQVQEMADLGYQVIFGTAPGTISPKVIPPDAVFTNIEEDDSVGWIEDLYDQVDTTLGGWLPGGVPIGSNWPQQLYNPPSVINPPVTNMPVQPPTQPPMMVAAAGCDNDPMKGMVWSKYCGVWAWRKKTRRRRKKLVTQGDAQGLSTLISILGNGKATQAWIATHT